MLLLLTYFALKFPDACVALYLARVAPPLRQLGHVRHCTWHLAFSVVLVLPSVVLCTKTSDVGRHFCARIDALFRALHQRMRGGSADPSSRTEVQRREENL